MYAVDKFWSDDGFVCSNVAAPVQPGPPKQRSRGRGRGWRQRPWAWRRPSQHWPHWSDSSYRTGTIQRCGIVSCTFGLSTLNMWNLENFSAVNCYSLSEATVENNKNFGGFGSVYGQMLLCCRFSKDNFCSYTV